MDRNPLLKLFIGAFLAFSSLTGRCGDSTGLSLSLIDYTAQNTGDTVSFGTTVTITALITNYDTGTFNGTLNFGIISNDVPITANGIFDKPRYSGDQVSIGGGQSVPALFSIYINNQVFMPGPDVVVVWPICNAPSVDSIYITLFVLDAPAGTSSIGQSQNAGFQYAVTPNNILLQNLPAGANFKQVRIFNVIGQQVYLSNKAYTTEVPLPNLPKGIYVAELLWNDDRKQMVRFFY
jgi:hypothetical protein